MAQVRSKTDALYNLPNLSYTCLPYLYIVMEHGLGGTGGTSSSCMFFSHTGWFPGSCGPNQTCIPLAEGQPDASACLVRYMYYKGNVQWYVTPAILEQQYLYLRFISSKIFLPYFQCPS